MMGSGSDGPSVSGERKVHPDGDSSSEDETGIREELKRFLAQRVELGQGPIILDSLKPEQVREAVGSPVRPDRRLRKAPPLEQPPEVALRSRSPMDPPSSHPQVPSEGGGFEPPRKYPELRAAALQCTRCGLAGERTQVVFSDGTPDASVMVVGEAPGANEDRTGLPFVGRAGKLLDLLLASVDLSRERNVYICNVLKCRPPGNRNPRPDEIESCAPWLRRQIELVSPRAILAVGTFSGKLLTGRDVALSKLRGQVYTYQGAPLVVTYHPAALLRNPRWVRPTWNDLQLLRGILDRG